MVKKIKFCIAYTKNKLLRLTLKNSRPGSMANSINVVFFCERERVWENFMNKEL